MLLSKIAIVFLSVVLVLSGCQKDGLDKCNYRKKKGNLKKHTFFIVSGTGMASGVPILWKENKYILTVNHFLNGDDSVFFLRENKVSHGRVVKRSDIYDLALIVPEKEGFFSEWFHISRKTLSNNLGSQIYYLGSPEAYNRGVFDGEIVAYNKGRSIKFDLEIFPGCSGGGIFYCKTDGLAGIVRLYSRKKDFGWGVPSPIIIKWLPQK